MLKLKKLINESAPGFTKRKFGDPLPTLSDIMKNQAIQATINYQRGYPYKTHRTGTELESVNEATYPKKGQVVAIGKDGIKFKLVNITHGHVGIPDDPSGTSFEFHALNKKYGKEHFTKKNWDFAMKKGWITVESVNEDNIKFSKEEMSQLHKDGKVEKGGHTIEFNESTKEYGKTLDKIAKDRQLKSISKKDRDTLIKIAKLMKRANESVNEGNLKYVIQYKKDKNRYLSNKSRDVKKVKDALQFKSEKDAKNQLNGLDWQFRGNYKIVKLKESVNEKISKDEWSEYPKYARKLKPYMQKLLKVPLKVRVIKQANHNPWIEVRVARFGKDVIPNDFRLKAAKVIGATSIKDKSNVNYGNIRSNSVSMKHDQWVKLLGRKV